MIYVSFSYYLFVAALAILYYLLPLRCRREDCRSFWGPPR